MIHFCLAEEKKGHVSAEEDDEEHDEEYDEEFDYIQYVIERSVTLYQTYVF